MGCEFAECFNSSRKGILGRGHDLGEGFGVRDGLRGKLPKLSTWRRSGEGRGGGLSPRPQRRAPRSRDSKSQPPPPTRMIPGPGPQPRLLLGTWLFVRSQRIPDSLASWMRCARFFSFFPPSSVPSLSPPFPPPFLPSLPPLFPPSFLPSQSPSFFLHPSLPSFPGLGPRSSSAESLHENNSDFAYPADCVLSAGPRLCAFSPDPPSSTPSS